MALRESLLDFINATKTSKNVLIELQEKIDSYHKVKSVVKGAGLLTSIAGGVLVVGGIGLALFTGGTSIVAATGAGFLLGTTGTVINLSADFVDWVTTFFLKKDLKKIVESRIAASENFCRNMEAIQQIAEILIENGLSEDDAIDIAYNAFIIGYDAASFRNNLQNFMSYVNEIIKRGFACKEAWFLAICAYKQGLSVYQIVQKARTTLDKFKILNKSLTAGKTFSSTLLRTGGNVWKNMRLVSETLVSILNIGKSTAMKVVKVGSIGLSGLFLGLDIKEFADTVGSKHPLSNVITQVIDKMYEELQVLEGIIEIL